MLDCAHVARVSHDDVVEELRLGTSVVAAKSPVATLRLHERIAMDANVGGATVYARTCREAAAHVAMKLDVLGWPWILRVVDVQTVGGVDSRLGCVPVAVGSDLAAPVALPLA